MNKKAQRYIKPEKLLHFKYLNQENAPKLLEPTPESQQMIINSHDKKNKSLSNKTEEDDVSKQNFEETESNNSENSENSSKQEREISPNENDSMRADLALNLMSNAATNKNLDSQPLIPDAVQGSVSSLSKPRKATIDPNILKNLKYWNLAKLEALNVDQIELAILILEKNFDDRTTKDLNLLVKCTENVAFFKKYDESTHRQCMAKMYHVHLKEGDSCIKFGQYGDTFWVLLKGKVGIYIPLERETIDSKGNLKKEKILTRVAEQGSGYAFGELALLERKPRAATIICEEDCEFAILDKTHFQKILLEKEEKRLFAEVNFLKEIRLFSKWSYSSIRTLYMYSKLRSFAWNQPVYQQFQAPGHLYIIKEGEFKVSFKEVYDEEDERVPVDATLEKFMNKRLPTRDVELAILGTGEIFGIEEIITGTTRNSTVTCVSQTSLVLQIEKKEVKNLILGEASARDWLKGYLASRTQLKEDRVCNNRDKTEKNKGFLMRTQPKNIKATFDLLNTEFTEKDSRKNTSSLKNSRLFEKRGQKPVKVHGNKNEHPLSRIFARTNDENTKKIDNWMNGRWQFLSAFKAREKIETNGDHTTILDSINHTRSLVREGTSSPLVTQTEGENTIPLKLNMMKIKPKNRTGHRAKSAGRLSRTQEIGPTNNQSRLSESYLKTLRSNIRDQSPHPRSYERNEQEKAHSQDISNTNARPSTPYCRTASLAIKRLHQTVSRVLGKTITPSHLNSTAKSRNLSQSSNRPKSAISLRLDINLRTIETGLEQTQQRIRARQTEPSKDKNGSVVSPYPMFLSKTILRSNQSLDAIGRSTRSLSPSLKAKEAHSSSDAQLKIISFEQGYQIDRGFKFLMLVPKDNYTQGKRSRSSIISEIAPTENDSHEELNNSQQNINHSKQLRSSSAKIKKERVIQHQNEAKQPIRVADILASKAISTSHA